MELFCFCVPSYCPHRIISLSLLVNRSFLIEEKCRFLSNFSQHTAEVELPGEFLLPKVRSVISMLKRTTRKPFQWWILDFIYIYVNVQEHKHTLKKKEEDFSVFKKNAKCLIHLKSSKSTIFCHWKLFMVKEYFLSALAWNTRGLDCCCHFKTIFYSFKGRAFYVLYNLYRSGKKNQILKLKYEIPMYTSQCETFSGG